MNVPATLMAVLTTASIPLDPTYAVVELDTDWLPTDAPVKVYIIPGLQWGFRFQMKPTLCLIVLSRYLLLS